MRYCLRSLLGCVVIAVNLVLVACAQNHAGGVMMADVSADGRYVVTSHKDNAFVLWDVESQSHSTISTDANIYSAHYSRYSDRFFWQDLDGRICSMSPLSGRSSAECINNRPVYGQVYIDPKGLHFFSDEYWYIETVEGRKLKRDDQVRSFYGAGKLLNLEGSPSGDRILSVGMPLKSGDEKPLEGQSSVDPEQRFSNFSGLVVWDLDRFEPIARMAGHNVKTHATFSPDGKYVVSVDENGLGFVWDAYDGSKVSRLARPGSGVWVGDDHPDPFGAPEEEVYDFEGIHIESADARPDDFSNYGMVSVQFISDTQYLLFFYNQRYAVIHELGDPFPQKFLDLGNRPHPSTGSYLRNASIASAPEAGILVTGQQSGNGINVYRFDEETKELERIWAPRR